MPSTKLGRAEHGAGEQVVVAAEILRRRVKHQVDAELQRPLVERRREGGVDQRLDPMAPADLGEALHVDDPVVRVGRRLADQHAGRRAESPLRSPVVSRRHRSILRCRNGAGLGQELPRAAVGVVGDDDVGIMREHGVERRRDRRHAAGKEQAVLGALQGRELLLGDALGRVAVAAVLFALDAVLKMVVQLLGIG
jgi:hypothetical protein